MSHFIHAVRRNVDITYLVMDNHIYGLTKGQVSPTSDPGFKTKSSPDGNIERPVRPLQLALAAGATFVAQGFSSNTKQLARLIEAGVKHKGFAYINCISPCVTFNRVNTYDWYKQVLVDLDEDPSYDPSNRQLAIQKVLEHDELVTGLIYQEPESVPYEAKVKGFKEEGLVYQDWRMDPAQFEKLMASFK